MGKMHRAQILLDPEQHTALADIAQREGTSISEIVRSAVQEWLDERLEDEIVHQRLEDVEIIQEHRQALLAQRGGQPLKIDIDRMIDQMRAERGDELLVNVYGRNP
jgi:hypothetical protein